MPIDRGQTFAVFFKEVSEHVAKNLDFPHWRRENAGLGFAKTSEWPGESSRHVQDAARKILSNPNYVAEWVRWGLSCERTWSPVRLANMMTFYTLGVCLVSEVTGHEALEPDIAVENPAV